MNDWIENAVQKIKENPQDIKVICAELWDSAYAIGAARQKTIINGNVVEYIPLRCVLEIIDKRIAYYKKNGLKEYAHTLMVLKGELYDLQEGEQE